MKSGAWTLCILTLCILAVLTNMNAQENMSKSADSPSVGPQIGAKAPAFAARDQFGHEQTNETLKGANGTVLLFFRSADW
jgi:hypothetical protein